MPEAVRPPAGRPGSAACRRGWPVSFPVLLFWEPAETFCVERHRKGELNEDIARHSCNRAHVTFWRLHHNNATTRTTWSAGTGWAARPIGAARPIRAAGRGRAGWTTGPDWAAGRRRADRTTGPDRAAGQGR